MKIKYALISFIFLFVCVSSKGQDSVSFTPKKLFLRSIIPTTLIVSGVIINGSQFEKKFQTNLRNKVGNDFNFTIENYLQYAPIAVMYIADIAGAKSKNHWFDQTKYLAISNLITSGITHGLKYLTSKTRPNGGLNSFPSGHTSFTFNNATVLYNEFHQTSPLLAYSGYVFAVTTGTLRMINNRHWLSDVLVGAGIGILVTNLVYYFEPFKNFNPFKKSQNISFFPQVNDKNYGFYFSYRF
jgi:hypothetical protein